jgi:undecaprenyl diphosphate synthase
VTEQASAVPQHVAIIMDGNRRWAKKRLLPRAFGHHSGAKRVGQIIRRCIEHGVGHLTLFAFSTENWNRDPDEVDGLIKLFLEHLTGEIQNMCENGIRFRVIGDISKFPADLQSLIQHAQAQTQSNQRITLYVAANYGGRWDVVNAVQQWQKSHPQLSINDLNVDALGQHLSTAQAPDVDLLIRTGGDSRISNFLLWQSAYAELYFCNTLWPDFDAKALDAAISWFSKQDRRFGGGAA